MAKVSNPYAFNFAAINSCEKQLKAFERAISKTPNTKPWSKHCFHFSFSLIIQSWARKHFENPHCWIESILSKKGCCL